MEKRQLGKTDMQITPLGIGTWAHGGGKWEWGWGPQNDEESIGAIHRFLDHGLNWVDTAAVYGLGRAEEVVAKALKGRSRRPYIFTKCSMLWNENGEIFRSMKADSIRRECENSLRRLQVDVIDLYQIHWPIPEEEIEEGWATMAELKAEGKVRHIGVSNFNIEQMKRIERIAPIDTLQPPYSLVSRSAEEELFPYCREHSIGVIVYSPMYSGLLTGAMTQERVAQFPEDDWRGRDTEFLEPRLSRNLHLVEVLRRIAERHRCSPGEVALAWVLRNPAVSGAIVGARRATQAEGVIGAVDLQLTDVDMAEIEDFLRENP